ncbi:hypothetical protein F0562_025281 [Nyssa sinensis]|uniref:Transposase MuDR plant domain-containing protein n=1 Tax=Nyssa sinensis TaxID=561372 RepID=A0A5J5BF86_9ASTE|nr:hypothetical protein F0562_025281 [Nyssa sinensis]
MTSEDEINISDNDDVYGLTNEDEAFVPSVGENLRNSTFNTTASPSVNVEVHGGDDLSDFESNDDAEYNPSSNDNSTDKGEGKDKGKGKSTSRVFEYNLYGKEYHAREGDKIVLKSGQLFEIVDKFKEVLRGYTIQQGCSIIRDKNKKARVTTHCADSSCMWRIHASLLPDGEAIKINLDIKVDAMQTYLQKTYGIEASMMQLYNTKRRALDEMEGKHESSYTMLPMNASEIRRTNPNNLVKIECQRPSLLMNPLFKRIFTAIEALFKGFKTGCRPFIGIDGCYLKGPYGGVFLAAVSLDGNNGLFPIAVGVVESVNRDSWGVFPSKPKYSHWGIFK